MNELVKEIALQYLKFKDTILQDLYPSDVKYLKEHHVRIITHTDSNKEELWHDRYLIGIFDWYFNKNTTTYHFEWNSNLGKN